MSEQLQNPNIKIVERGKLIPRSKKTMTYDIGNQGPGLGQTRKYGRDKPVNGVRTIPSG
jgi:hypothetical protein